MVVIESTPPPPASSVVAQLPVKLLAYMGDGVYELWARYTVLQTLEAEMLSQGVSPPSSVESISVSPPASAWQGLTPLTNQCLNTLHTRVTQFTQGCFQAHALMALLALEVSQEGWHLTLDEQTLIHRFMNTRHKSTRHKRQDQAIIRQATALEALIGYWHMQGEHHRLNGFWLWLKGFHEGYYPRPAMPQKP